MPLADNQAIATYHFSNADNSHHCVTSIASIWPNSYTIADYLTTMKLVAGTTFVGDPPFKLNQFSSEWNWTELSMLGRKVGLLYNGTTSGLGAGTLTHLCPPINVSTKINKKTGIAGRKYRGLFMVPPMHLNEETQVDSGGFIDGGRVTSISQMFENMRVQMVNNGLTPLLIHGDATTATVVTSFSCGTQVGTIRKRLRP